MKSVLLTVANTGVYFFHFTFAGLPFKAGADSSQLLRTADILTVVRI